MFPPRPLRRPRSAAPLALAAALLLGPAPALPAASAPGPAFAGPADAGRLTFPPKNEASGLAASRRTPDLLWLLDDSGGAPELYAAGADGRPRGTLQIGGGTKNEDWEDLAAVTLDGTSFLVIGDIGDNDAKRRRLAVHFVPEPAATELRPDGRFAERPAATLQVTYADGPRDAESLAVDPEERALYVLTKREDTPRLYRAALPPAPLSSGPLVLRFVGLVPHVPAPTAAERKLKGRPGSQRTRPCAMDFAPDRSAAVVLTYGDVLLFPRRDGESWAEALARPPVILGAHGLPQAEAVCFSADSRTIYVASEQTRQLLRYTRP